MSENDEIASDLAHQPSHYDSVKHARRVIGEKDDRAAFWDRGERKGVVPDVQLE